MLSEFVYEYHGRHLRAMCQTRVEFQLVRFAWTVIYLIKSFLFMGRPKTMLGRYRDWDDGVPKVKEQGLLAKNVDMLFSGGGTRSASPRTRSPTSSQSQGSDCVWGESDGRARREPSSSNEEEERGRKRPHVDDNLRYKKRRRVHERDSSEANDSVPWLEETGSSPGKSVSSLSIKPRTMPECTAHEVTACEARARVVA